MGPPWLRPHHWYLNKTSGAVCGPISLPKGGKLIINETLTFTLDQHAIFRPDCTSRDKLQFSDQSLVRDMQEPFYASSNPQIFALAAATVISYLLVIILFITPRTFFVGGRGGGFLGRHGMISGSYGSSSVIGVGGRPWLQKVAALTVAVSLTIATSDTFNVAKEQYDDGYTDSSILAGKVINGTEIRVIRVISGTFLWLAQVQTLIRLFPRHKEKVIIKWVGFAMIVLDTIFSILNSFVKNSPLTVRVRNLDDPVPALNYLFELSLSLLYAAWVIFYSLSKHRFAFFHVKMRNMCIVALLSLISILIPIVFFILDISQPDLAVWGEYIRWVGAAAASVVVWEWVERIEALEREERKDGILGREVFDGDEMLQATPSEDANKRNCRRGGHGGKGGGKFVGWFGGLGISYLPSKAHAKIRTCPKERRKRSHQGKTNRKTTNSAPESHITPPPQTITPVSRTDTASAASTVYRVRYHTLGTPVLNTPAVTTEEPVEKESPAEQNKESEADEIHAPQPSHPRFGQSIAWLGALNPFKRRRGSPPHEVATAQAEEGNIRHTKTHDERHGLRSPFYTVRSLLRGGAEESGHEEKEHSGASALPVTVIPARPRRQRTAPSRASGLVGSRLRRSDTQERGSPEVTLPIVVIPAQPRSGITWATNLQGDSNTPSSNDTIFRPDSTVTEHRPHRPTTSTPATNSSGATMNASVVDVEAEPVASEGMLESPTNRAASPPSNSQAQAHSATGATNRQPYGSVQQHSESQHDAPHDPGGQPGHREPD